MKRYYSRKDTVTTNRKYSKNVCKELSSLKVNSLEGQKISDIDVFIESGETLRKVRRIMEKRVAQGYWQGKKYRGDSCNRHVKKLLSDDLRTIYGSVPRGFVYHSAA